MSSFGGGDARNKQMTDTIGWWARAFHPDEDVTENPEVGMKSAQEMQEILTWWGQGHPGGPDEMGKKTMQVKQVLDGWGDASIALKDKAKALQEAMGWCIENYPAHRKKLKELEGKTETKQKLIEFFEVIKQSKADDYLDFWKSNMKKEIDIKAFEGDEKKMAKKCEKAFLVWRDRELAKPTKQTGKDLEETLLWWSKNRKKKIEKMSYEDRLMFDKLAQGVSGRKMPEYGSDEEVPADVVEFMRNKNNIKILEDTLALWHKHDEPVDTFGHIKNEEERMKLTKLRDAFVQWQKMKLEDPLTAKDANRIRKEIAKAIIWWEEEEGESYDADDALEEMKHDVWKAMSCEQAVGLWHMAIGKAGRIPPLNEQSKLDAVKTCVEVEDAMSFYRKEGQFMDLTEAEAAQAEYDDKYEKAKRLAKFWGRYSKPVDSSRSAAAAELMTEIMEWNRDTKKKKKKEEPEKITKVEGFFGIFHPIQAPDINDKEATEELLDILEWWGTQGYEVELTKVGGDHKKHLKKLKEAVKYAETTDSNAFKSTEDEGLEWKRDPDAALEMEKEIDYNISDILDWFKGGQISAKKKKHIGKLEGYIKNWWDNLTDEEKEKEVDPTGQNMDAYIGPEVDNLVDMYNSINPLQVFWKDKGYEYAKRSGFYKPEEAEDFNQRVEECWEWLSVKLNQKKGDGDEESDDE
ncbi:receptor kinase [Seminavis robusta]|uniref:Receptor kinase n=2 Tax=Seminavis robusta TaxID=568900 RepID=A0A9N8EH67_9STRA|nr:receptor kinase [Seminavis robusta]|eukprot:Sro988_g228440.1 receptor kinase (689) ;mRNA; r:32990-35056